jgi:hypothetical protein
VPELPARLRLISQNCAGLAGRGIMSLAVAEYLRHLATRCSRMSRDCTDRVVSKELVQISVELVEKAQDLEAEFKIEGSPDRKDMYEVIAIADDDDAA